MAMDCGKCPSRDCKCYLNTISIADTHEWWAKATI